MRKSPQLIKKKKKEMKMKTMRNFHDKIDPIQRFFSKISTINLSLSFSRIFLQNFHRGDGNFITFFTCFNFFKASKHVYHFELLKRYFFDILSLFAEPLALTRAMITVFISFSFFAKFLVYFK